MRNEETNLDNSPAEHSTPLALGEGIGGEATPAEHSTPLAFGEGLEGEATPAEHSTPLSLGEGQGGEAATYAYMTASPDRYGLLKQFAKENKQNMTVAERYLWDHLRDYQHTYHFRRQHIIGDYIVDFVSLDIKLVIEVDGGYHAERQQMEDDARRTEDLNHMGFDVVRFTNEEVLFDTGKTLERLRKILGIE
jgi:very-short-patch-repair endonuclease